MVLISFFVLSIVIISFITDTPVQNRITQKKMSDLYPEILSLNANGLQTSAPDPHVSNNTDEHTLRNPDKNCFYNLAFDGSDCNGTPRPDIQANEEMAKTGTPASSECCSDALHGPDTPRHGGKQRMEALR